ncbi:hypothetical protein II898_03520 [bacterium]|nr:hypothetical protein [bacterium]
MKTLSFKFVFELLLAFALFSFILYSLEISQFLFPHFPIVATILYTEKNTRKRITYMILATLIYSQAATPLPFLFILTVALQIYILTVAFFASTAFDYSLTALLNAILSSLMINFDKLLYTYVFTGELSAFSFLFPSAFSAFLLIFLFVVFKPKVDTLFYKETWL